MAAEQRRAGSAGPIAVDRLVLCSKRREQGRVSARALARVRERILDRLAPEPSPYPRRIFITRADSRFRQVVDEDAMLAALAPLGFERVRLSALPWSEQVRLFRDVEAVVAAHGAGMTNIMFSTRRPMVVELFGQKVSHMNYTVGLGIGCDHRVLRCRADGDDLLVDGDALRRLIAL
jgi:capsular polysaccharide biosynthesis protein